MVPNQASSAEIHHPLKGKDDGFIAALRAQVAPLKGHLDGPHARGVFDDVMEHTPDAAGVRYEEGAVGGVRGLWCRPPNARHLTRLRAGQAIAWFVSDSSMRGASVRNFFVGLTLLSFLWLIGALLRLPARRIPWRPAGGCCCPSAHR